MEIVRLRNPNVWVEDAFAMIILLEMEVNVLQQVSFVNQLLNDFNLVCVGLSILIVENYLNFLYYNLN